MTEGFAGAEGGGAGWGGGAGGGGGVVGDKNHKPFPLSRLPR